MPCRKVATFEGKAATSGAYATEAACNDACKEGACCETENGVTTCSVKPQCQCQGTGKVFKGIGTTCDQYKGACCTTEGSMTTCAVVSECECQAAGKSFSGVGTTCSPNPCTVCVCKPPYESPENVFKPDEDGEIVSSDDAAGRPRIPETVTVVYFSVSQAFSIDPAWFSGSYVLRRNGCRHFWSAPITANGVQWVMKFGTSPVSGSFTIDEPALWVSGANASYFGLAAFLLGNVAGPVNAAQAQNAICAGGGLTYATQSGSVFASVSPNPLP